MMRILLPKPLDHMSERENKKYAQVINEISHAASVDDEKTVIELLRKYKLKLA